jgi:hypothetical protein
MTRRRGDYIRTKVFVFVMPRDRNLSTLEYTKALGHVIAQTNVQA